MLRSFALAASRRLAIMLAQMFAVVVIVFLLARVFLESPARALAGQNQSADAVRAIEERLGLDDPIHIQLWNYLGSVVQLDFGRAFSTGNPVSQDLAERIPSTLFLVTLSLLIAGVLALLLAFAVTHAPRGLAARASRVYGFVAGAIPDFWLGLALIFIFYYKLNWLPAPAGQIDPLYSAPTITGIAVIDSLYVGDMAAFSDAVLHLILPVATLVIVYMGPALRLVAAESQNALNEDYVRFARVLGLKSRRVSWYAVRQSIPTFLTIMATTYGFLLGGAVLVETVFSWGGAGQYAVAAVAQSDFAALQGFVIAAGVFTAFVYAMLDLGYYLSNPVSR